jgi:hypothetical protein
MLSGFDFMRPKQAGTVNIYTNRSLRFCLGLDCDFVQDPTFNRLFMANAFPHTVAISLGIALGIAKKGRDSKPRKA